MTSSDMVRKLCEKTDISLAELYRRIGQTHQNYNKRLKRGTVSFDEMVKILGFQGVGYARKIEKIRLRNVLIYYTNYYTICP